MEAQVKVEEPSVIDLDDSEWYLNRELTWLAFNRRVMSEAADIRVPLLERVKFLAIVGSNLDEFFMKRIGGLKQQLVAGVQELTVDGRSPRQQLQECHEQVRILVKDKAKLFRQLMKLLEDKGIDVVGWKDLNGREQKSLRELYARDIYPLLTPQSIDPAHPFPFVSNLSLNLLVTVRYPRENDVSLARVKVPLGPGVSRFMRVGKADRFVPLEEVMAANLDMLFPGMKVISCEFFRVTRNANTEKDEEKADDLVAMIESELQERRFAPIVRLGFSRRRATPPPNSRRLLIGSQPIRSSSMRFKRISRSTRLIASMRPCTLRPSAATAL